MKQSGGEGDQRGCTRGGVGEYFVMEGIPFMLATLERMVAVQQSVTGDGLLDGLMNNVGATPLVTV